MSLWRRHHKKDEDSSLPEAEAMNSRLLDKYQRAAVMETEVIKVADKLIKEGGDNHFGYAFKISFGLR